MLMLAQIDDRSGEVLGAALEHLMALGAHNVQLLDAHTKKGRPGFVLLIDVADALEHEVAAYLASELGAWGYHILASRHRHFDIAEEQRDVVVVCGARRRTFALVCKFVSHQGSLLRVKIERRDVEEIGRFVQESDAACSSDNVRVIVEGRLRRHPEQPTLEIDLS
jgi:uncharacterized protein (DUF111 family)